MFLDTNVLVYAGVTSAPLHYTPFRGASRRA